VLSEIRQLQTQTPKVYFLLLVKTQAYFRNLSGRVSGRSHRQSIGIPSIAGVINHGKVVKELED